jgi:hypothetical protein
MSNQMKAVSAVERYSAVVTDAVIFLYEQANPEERKTHDQQDGERDPAALGNSPLHEGRLTGAAERALKGPTASATRAIIVVPIASAASFPTIASLFPIVALAPSALIVSLLSCLVFLGGDNAHFVAFRTRNRRSSIQIGAFDRDITTRATEADHARPC